MYEDDPFDTRLARPEDAQEQAMIAGRRQLLQGSPYLAQNDMQRALKEAAFRRQAMMGNNQIAAVEGRDDAAMQARRALMNRNLTALEDMAGMKREGPDNIVNSAMQRRAQLAAQMSPQAARNEMLVNGPGRAMPQQQERGPYYSKAAGRDVLVGRVLEAQDGRPQGFAQNASGGYSPIQGKVSGEIRKTAGGKSMAEKRREDESTVSKKRGERLAAMNDMIKNRGMAQAAPRIALEEARAKAIAARYGGGKQQFDPNDLMVMEAMRSGMLTEEQVREILRQRGILPQGAGPTPAQTGPQLNPNRSTPGGTFSNAIDSTFPAPPRRYPYPASNPAVDAMNF